ncbi:PD-(D/E)XK nuclease family protein [Candidatus Falkowbacteria bacterium]|nr:PD-(D/E)XK nuclease family protein [Candidatus Falkowbacteria bacterium]
MSQYYNPRRTKYLFNPNDEAPFRLSRSKIDLFLECPRCFYLDRRAGISRPPGFPFALNSAVDLLLKKEFDIHRAGQTKHPIMEAYGVDAVPFQHEKINDWRDAMHKGVEYLHEPTNFFVTGGVDDVWVNPAGELIVVDYKATSKEGEVSLDADWQIGYKRQMEVYQWLLRKNGFRVSDTGYFVYVNGKTDREAFDGRLEFDVKLIPYVGNDSWIEKTLIAGRECLDGDEIPAAGPDCDYCQYVEAAKSQE